MQWDCSSLEVEVHLENPALQGSSINFVSFKGLWGFNLGLGWGLVGWGWSRHQLGLHLCCSLLLRYSMLRCPLCSQQLLLELLLVQLLVQLLVSLSLHSQSICIQLLLKELLLLH